MYKKDFDWLNYWGNLFKYDNKESKDFREGYRQAIRDCLDELYYKNKSFNKQRIYRQEIVRLLNGDDASDRLIAYTTCEIAKFMGFIKTERGNGLPPKDESLGIRPTTL
jgi:hypothetical protein